MMSSGPSDIGRALVLAQRGSAAGADIARVADEITSGQVRDPVKAAGGDAAQVYAVESYLSDIKVDREIVATAQRRSEVAQLTLNSLRETILPLGPNLTAAATADDSLRAAAYSQTAAETLDFALAGLNASIAGRSLFGGVSNDTPLVGSGEALLADVRAAIAAGQDTPIAAVEDYFSDGGGFSTAFWQGGPKADTLTLASGHSLESLPTGDADAFRSMLEGLTLAALSTDESLAPERADQLAFQQSAGKALSTAADELTTLQAEIGTGQERAVRIESILVAEQTAAEITRGAFFNTDPYAASAELTALEAQLEALYTITARLSQLSLTNYLR